MSQECGSTSFIFVGLQQRGDGGPGPATMAARKSAFFLVMVGGRIARSTVLESSLMRPSLRKRSRAVRLDVAHGSASSVQGIMADRPGRKPYEDGKKSVEMFLNAVLCLPHVICSPVGWDCGRDNE